MRLAGAALAAVIVLALPIGAGADESFEAQASLHLLYTNLDHEPSTLVLYDRQARTFDIGSYLAPVGDDRYGSFIASVRLRGSLLDGNLRWVFAADSGEVRTEAFPLTAPVCPATGQTGLAVFGSGRCTGSTFPVEETRYGAPVAVSNGRAIGEEARSTLFIREAYAAWTFGPAGFATVRAGRKRTTVADGFVHDDYSTGVEMDLDLGALGPSFDVGAGIYNPSRDFPWTTGGISPLAVLRADYLPSLFERAGVFLAGMRDRTGSVGEIMRGTVVETRVSALSRSFGTPDEATAARQLVRTLADPLASDAIIGWAGTSGSLTPLRHQRLLWTAALQGGTLFSISATGTSAGPLEFKDMALNGKLATVKWESDLGNRVVLAASYLYLSGSTPPSPKDSYNAFLGISPFITTTNLFFDGGLSESYASRQVTSPGVNGRGVNAPALSLTAEPFDAVSVVGKAAYLRSNVPGPFGGSVYGTEADLTLTFSPLRWLMVGAELDALWQGDFYAGRSTVKKTVLAVDFATP